MEICLMIEGQEGVTWDEWLALAAACEEHGLHGLFTSDHYLSFHRGREQGSFDAWTVLAAIATRTERIRLGTLVSPVTFRHPSVLAKAAVSVDHVSGGRVEVGMGAAWNFDEHRAYGFGFPDTGTRMAMLAEQLEIVHRTWTEDPVTFEGAHYRLEASPGLPKPVQRPHPPIVVGGSGRPRSVSLAARWADEYDAILKEPEDFAELRSSLDAALAKHGRRPEEMRLSWMGPATGTVEEVVERLGAYRDAGLARVYFQQLDHRDLERIALIGREVVPALS